jgi:hypothetical protein
MQTTAVEIEGVVGADGALIIHEKLSLPPGPVRVTVQPRPETNSTEQSPSGMTPAEQFWAGMHAIWADLEAHGHVPRSKEEIDAEIRELRDEAEEQMKGYDRLHEEGNALS